MRAGDYVIVVTESGVSKGSGGKCRFYLCRYEHHYAMRKLPALKLTVKSGGFVCGVLDCAARGPEAGQWFWFVTGPQARVPGARESDRGWTPTLEAAREEHAAAWGRWRQWAGLVQVRPLTCGRPPETAK